MYWKLILNQKEGRMELWKDDDNECLGVRTWQEERNTSQEILNALQEIKEEKELTWNQVSEFRLELDLPPHATARRIAETFEKTYNTFVA